MSALFTICLKQKTFLTSMVKSDKLSERLKTKSTAEKTYWNEYNIVKNNFTSYDNISLFICAVNETKTSNG